MATKKPRRKSSIDHLTNTMIESLIDEYIHSDIERRVLKRRLLDGVTYACLGEEFGYSERQIKRIVYKAEEKLFKHIEP